MTRLVPLALLPTLVNNVTMKTLLISFIVLIGHWLITAQVFAQSIPTPPCQQVDVDTDTTKRRLLYEFIDASLKNRRFVNDKGIVQLNVYKNKEGLTCWMLIPHIDDSYKDNPPPAFDDLNGD